MAQPWLVLGAMGVIFDEPDDVAAHLVPFVRERNPQISARTVRNLYNVLIIGEISTLQFWRSLGLPDDSDAEYVPLYRLDPLFLPLAREWVHATKLGLIANQVAEWWAALRQLHGLGDVISVATVSGTSGSRKPDTGIFKDFLAESAAQPSDCLFVDDRAVNLAAAARLGFHPVLFDRAPGQDWPGPRASSFDELAPIAAEWLSHS